jgi:hypothetical protein
MRINAHSRRNEMKYQAWVKHCPQDVGKGTDLQAKYCVLGAAMQTLKTHEKQAFCKKIDVNQYIETLTFPNSNTGKAFLEYMGVPSKYSTTIADNIIKSNDAGNFDRAWRYLAIAYRLIYREQRREMRQKQHEMQWIPTPEVTKESLASIGAELLSQSQREAIVQEMVLNTITIKEEHHGSSY